MLPLASWAALTGKLTLSGESWVALGFVFLFVLSLLFSYLKVLVCKPLLIMPCGKMLEHCLQM